MAYIDDLLQKPEHFHGLGAFESDPDIILEELSVAAEITHHLFKVLLFG